MECYDSREDDYKRRASALLHSFLLQTAHEHLLAKNSAQGRKIRKSDVIAEQLLRYLNQNYTKHLTSQEIEELFEGNFDYLNRVFSSLTGSPVFAYLNILRINNAKQLISTTDLPFSEIAYLVGIEDRYYFPSCFENDRHESDGILQGGQKLIRCRSEKKKMQCVRHGGRSGYFTRSIRAAFRIPTATGSGISPGSSPGWII